MQKTRRSFYFIAAFVLTAGAMLAFLHQLGIFEVASVPIDLVLRSTGEDGKPRAPGIAETKMKERLNAQLAHLKGKRIWEIDLSKMRASLARDEWVKDIAIARRLPNEVRVSVRPKSAALVLVSKQGEFIPITDDSELLSALPSGQLPDVPILRGEIFAKDRARRDRAVKLALALSEDGPLGRHNVSEISWTNEEGYVLTLIQPKVEVKLGEERVDLKTMRVAQVLNYLSANNLRGRVIDASFSKKVLVRLRKGP